MARRFRRLRRAAHQVIEVTRRFWRFCHCCGTVKAETSRDIIPVAVVLSCTNLPRARGSFFSWHWCTRRDTREGDVIKPTSGSFIGPQNWIRPTDSGIQAVCVAPSSSQSGQDAIGTYMPGTFSRDLPSSSSRTSFSTGVHQPAEASLDYRDLRASRAHLNYFPPSCSSTVPIWSVSSSSQTDDHVPLRYLYESQISQSSVYSEESEPRNWGSSNPVDAFRSPSGRLSIDTVGRDYLMNPSTAAGPLTPRSSTINTVHASINSINPSLASVELPLDITSPRRTRFQRFDENDKYLGYLPSPSGTSLVVAPSPYSKTSRALPKPVPNVKSVPSIPSRNPIDAFRSPSGKMCVDRVGSKRCCHQHTPSESKSLVVSRIPSSTIGLCTLFNSSRNSIQMVNNAVPAHSATNSRFCVIGNTANANAPQFGSNTSLSIHRSHSSTIPLPGYSKADPELRLNLNLLGDSSDRVVISPNLRVEFAVRSKWNAIDPGSWGHRHTIARTKCGTVDIAYCQKFEQKFALKTLSPDSGKTEVELLQKCQCPFVAEMHAVINQGEERLLCTSYYEKLDLAHWLQKDERRTHFGESEAALICSYVLTGLEFIHNKGVLHLDIKPANILLCSKAYPVIGDFGSARNVNGNADRFCHFTPAYASPEVLAGELPTNQADFWSTASVFYEIVCGKTPYQGQYDLETELKIVGGSTPDVSMLSIDGQHFICAQFKSDKTNRLGFSFGAREMMRHRVFHAIDWDEIKYGHRHSDSKLLEVLMAVETSDEKKSQTSTGSICNNNNSSRWELWSSSSSGEDSDEEFGFTSRELYTVEEESAEYGDPEGPDTRETSRVLWTVEEDNEEHGDPEGLDTRDTSRVLWTVDEEDEEYGGTVAPYGIDMEETIDEAPALSDNEFEDTGGG